MILNVEKCWCSNTPFEARTIRHIHICWEWGICQLIMELTGIFGITRLVSNVEEYGIFWLGSDHPFRDSASYVTKTAGTNRLSHSLVTRFTAKCDFGLSENFEWWKVKSCLQCSCVSQLLIHLPQCLLSICTVSEMSYRLFKWTNNDQVV